jgi:dihydropyrimidinase
VCSNHKAYTNEKKKSLGKNDFTHIPHGHNGVEERLAILWEQLVFNEKSTASKFVALSSSNSAKIMNLWPQKGCIAPESDADLVIWNPNNFRTISSREESESNADVNAFDGLTVHGAPEYVIANGKVVVYEYEMNPNVSQGQILVAEPFPSILYDQVQDLDELSQVVGVQRDQPAEEAIEEVDTVDRGGSNQQDFGMTTPRKNSEPPVLNKRLGIYQRPMSAHGVRNQQDSTFSLAGDGNIGSPKRGVKINAPPGGDSRAFW